MPNLKKETAVIVDQWLTQGLDHLRKMVERGQIDRVTFTAVADEIEAIRDDWRMRWRTDELS